MVPGGKEENGFPLQGRKENGHFRQIMKFYYKAKRGPNEIVQGDIVAANQDVAVAKLRQMGLVPIYVKTKTTGGVREKSIEKKKKQIFSGGKVTKTHIYIFTKKLRVFLRSQEPLLKSLYFLESQITNKNFKNLIKSIIEAVREGLSFSDSLDRFPQYFSPLYISIIRAGEASGKLDESLNEIAKYLDDEKQLSQKVMSSLAYPVVMVSVGFATIIFIITFVVPKLRGLFEDFADKLPIMTKLLLDLSTVFSRYWIIIFGGFAGFVVFLVYTKEEMWQKRALGVIKKKTPVVKDIIFNQSLCRFARGMSILLASGVSLLEAIRISIPLIEDEAARGELDKACQQIIGGAGLEESLRENCRYIPDMFIKMVAVGEASGRLDEILNEMADSYSEEVETMTKMVTSLIEPVAILIVGGILGFIVIAVLLPIFEMSLFVQ
ncbi:MAG: type II secretion system F family protein [Candidatus Omnitrophica bacterium]|nr:type II secretion system F family protein [Candidatus Omnitrophota bacterium]